MPSLLDLFCKAGGCSMGYHRAGFDRIVGIDIELQKHYPFEFIQADALEYVEAYGQEFDYIHASPPCQLFSVCTPQQYKANHKDLITPLRPILRKVGKPYIIENVSGARHMLIDPIMLCGSSFGLKLWRHRYFEIWPNQIGPAPACRHDLVPIPILISGTTSRLCKNGVDQEYTLQQCKEASDIDWMTREEIDQAIPPAYTKWIGEYLLTGKRPVFPLKQGFFW
jgi:DNA (cytosine-5)-methyltransferase 1